MFDLFLVARCPPGHYVPLPLTVGALQPGVRRLVGRTPGSDEDFDWQGAPSRHRAVLGGP